MRQIALFTTDWNYELVGETLRGVSAYLRLHPEVNVRVFDCFSIDEEDLEDLSLYEIYQLADLDQYDGAIVQTHQIVVKDVARRLERRLKAKGIPSVTVGVPLGEMPQVRSNDHESFYRITEHLIRTHGVKSLWFLKGPEQYDEGEQSEPRQRRLGFQDACRDFGIPEENIRFLEGNWKTYAGEEAGRQIAAAEKRPEALVCVNDDMALGAISALKEAGLNVPEDILVTGYDGIFSASLCTPRLATVDRSFRDVGFQAMETVMAMVEGKKTDPVIYHRVQPVLKGTCGCRADTEAEVYRIKDQFYRQTRFLRQFYLTQDKIAGAFFSAETLQDVMEAMEKYCGIFGADDLRIYLDERYYRSLHGRTTEEEEDRISRGEYSGCFVLTADSREHVSRNEEYRVVTTGMSQHKPREILPARARLSEYYPLSLGRTMVGVLMLRGECAAAEMNLHESIVNELVLSLETIRQRQRQNRLTEKLNDLYVTDQLTGLNNRAAYEEHVDRLEDEIRGGTADFAIAVFDVNSLKELNDRYGHKKGDEVIRSAAAALQSTFREGKLYRIGGDEFLVILESSYAELPQKLASVRGNQAGFSISAGSAVYNHETDREYRAVFNRADTAMYNDKREYYLTHADRRHAPLNGHDELGEDINGENSTSTENPVRFYLILHWGSNKTVKKRIGK